MYIRTSKLWRWGRRTALCAGALVVALAPAGCNTVPSQVGDQIASRMPGVLGPADHYDAQVNGSIFDLMRGKVSSVHIHGDNVALSPAVHVASFDADVSDIHANTRTDTIESIGGVRFHIVIDQANLDNYLQSARPDDFARGARITVGQTALTYSDSVRIFGLRAPFSITGTLSPHPGAPSQMDFLPSSASIISLRLPERLVDRAVDSVNPIVDLSQMKYPVQIRRADVENGQLFIDGSVDASSLLKSSLAP